jgi:hypothetical protein
MSINEQIKQVEEKILELGLADAPPSMIEDKEEHLKNLIELKDK